jgi:hypothetical protein
MPIARIVRTLGLPLLLGFAGFGGGCGPESPTLTEEENQQIKASHKATHDQLKETIDKSKAAAKTQKGLRGSRRGR